MKATGYPQRATSSDTQASAQAITGAREIAILVAANHLTAAEAMLRAALDDPATREDEQAWLMLLELLCLAGRREEFDALLDAYRDAHGSSGPRWGLAEPVEAPGTHVLRGVIRGQPEELDELRRFAAARKTMVIDLGQVERIDYAGLHAFQQVFSQLSASGRRVILSNVSELAAVLLQAVGMDRHAVIMRRKVSEARLAGLTSRPALRSVDSPAVAPRQEAEEQIQLAA
jgi:anti-anti-sigma regulatory factor